MPNDNSSPAVINFPLVDKLIVELDEYLPSRHCKLLLFRIYNAIHGIDNIDEFCCGSEGKPTRFVPVQRTEVC
jgi:hypothetical protein